MTDTHLTQADEGKRVLNVDGTVVGRLVEVSDGRGYVAPDPGFVETIRAKIGWGDATADAHPLDEGSIEEITDESVRLSGTL